MSISTNRKIEQVGHLNTMSGLTYNGLRAGGE